MIIWLNKIRKACGRFIDTKQGTIAVAFAVMMPVVVGSAGMALDLSQAYLVRQRLAGALDAAALAGAAAGDDEAEITEKVEAFFERNYPAEKIGTAYGLEVNVDEGEVAVFARADFPTAFLHVLGYEEITVSSGTIVSREVMGIEVALVLDNTGSMATNNNIETLRVASKRFVDIMFDSTSDPNMVKIGVVPFSSTVNVGPYGLGLMPDGTAYGDPATPFVNNTVNGRTYRYSTTDNTQWRGCVLAREAPLDTQDHTGPWQMAGREDSSTRQVCTGSGRRRVCNNVTTYSWNDLVACPAPILPMTSNETDLINRLNSMQANGNTLINFGAVWGLRLLSPEFPFTEGSDWDDDEWRKVVIIMTDGDNVIGGDSTYTAYGYGRDHSLTDGDLNDKLETVCETFADNDVIVYTIIFTSGIDQNTRNMFRDCASDSDKYFFAPTQADLESVFEQIARELSTLHIRG